MPVVQDQDESGHPGRVHDEDLIERRVRNRIIDYLDLVSSPQAQLEYQDLVPHVYVPHEVINQWEDWTFGDPSAWPTTLNRNVYTVEEITAMQQFHSTWLAVVNQTPNPLPPLPATILLREWGQLCQAASEALTVFLRRGRLSD